MAIRTFDSNDGSYYARVRGSVDGIFYAPYLPASRLRWQYDNSPGFSSFRISDEAGFIDFGDALYDRAADLPDRDVVAIIDAGVVIQHPLLRPRIVAHKDFTDEGIDDHSGHGTMRALRVLNHQPTARFVVAKVVGTKSGTRQAVIEAFHWATEKGAGVFYVALGEYNLFCRGGCSLCRAAQEAGASHHVVIAAPGNRFLRVACPAKAKWVTRTVLSKKHLLLGLRNILQRTDLSTIPAYFSYPGERSLPTFPVTPLGADLEGFRESHRRALRKGGGALTEFLQETRMYLTSILASLPYSLAIPDETWGRLSSGILAQVAVIDQIWERITDALLAALQNVGGPIGPVAAESMWVPLAEMSANRRINATVPREMPSGGRHLMTAWEYAWANMARIFWGPQREAFYEKTASQLKAYLSGNPGDADAHFQLGVLFLAHGNLVGARQSLLRARDLRPNWTALSAALQQVSHLYNG